MGETVLIARQEGDGPYPLYFETASDSWITATTAHVPKELWDEYVQAKNAADEAADKIDDILDNKGGDKDGNQRTRPDTREVNNVFEQAEGRETS